MVGCKVLILLVVMSLTFSEILAGAIRSDSDNVTPRYGERVMASGQASFHVSRDKTILLVGIAAAAIWFVKGMFIYNYCSIVNY